MFIRNQEFIILKMIFQEKNVFFLNFDRIKGLFWRLPLNRDKSEPTTLIPMKPLFLKVPCPKDFVFYKLSFIAKITEFSVLSYLYCLSYHIFSHTIHPERRYTPCFWNEELKKGCMNISGNVSQMECTYPWE